MKGGDPAAGFAYYNEAQVRFKSNRKMVEGGSVRDKGRARVKHSFMGLLSVTVC